ncbi:hypothetical protein BH09ACT9_BH09ACT9_35810 [soil metagenome]
MIGHPVVRAWYARHNAPEGRPPLGDDSVQHLLTQIAPGSPLTDLGGEDSLNIRLDTAGLVLRVHKPPMTKRRLDAEHQLRIALAAQGLLVPTTVDWNGRSSFRCGTRWAELEHYLALRWAPAGDVTNRWLFTAIGHLHKALSKVATPLPRPLTRSWATPITLRRWLDVNVAAGVESLQDPAVVDDVAQLIRQLRRRWIPAARLPSQLIHGDLHQGNIMQDAHGDAVYLDLTGIAHGPRIHDLAYAIANLSFWSSLEWTQVPLLIQAYEEGAGWRLSSLEREALPAYIAAVPLYIDICDWSDQPRRSTARWLLGHDLSI